MIRPARLDDVSALLPLLAAFHAASGMASIAAYDPDTMAATLRQMIEAPGGVLLSAWDGGEAVGVAGAMVVPPYWNAGAKVAQEVFWWVLPDYRGTAGPAMLQAMETAAKDMGAGHFMMVCLEALRPEAVGKLYERRGYRPLEHNYVRAL